MNKAVQHPLSAADLPSEIAPELVELSKRLTQRAAAGMVKTETRRDYSRLSLEAEGDHIAALQRYIRSKEAIVDRFRDQLERFPKDIATLRDRLAAATDASQKETLSKNLEAYCAMRDALQHRVEVFDATWPDRNAEMMQAIESHERRRASSV